MKTIIAGSRGINDYQLLEETMDLLSVRPTLILCGDAPGPDRLGERWAIENKVPVKHFPADWDFFGKQAGMLRNVEMVKEADLLVALWDGHSKGTQQVIRTALAHGLKVVLSQCRLKSD